MTPATTIEVLADPSRRQILDALRDGEQSVNALVTRLGLSQPSASKHLKVLRDAGLVAVRPDGQRRLYRLRTEPLMALDAWLEPYRQLWRTSLDKLERHLAETDPDPNEAEPGPNNPDRRETDPSPTRRNAP